MAFSTWIRSRCPTVECIWPKQGLTRALWLYNIIRGWCCCYCCWCVRDHHQRQPYYVQSTAANSSQQQQQQTAVSVFKPHKQYVRRVIKLIGRKIAGTNRNDTIGKCAMSRRGPHIYICSLRRRYTGTIDHMLLLLRVAAPPYIILHHTHNAVLRSRTGIH